MLKGHEDGDGFSYCGAPRSPSLGHSSPLDGTGMFCAGSTTNPLGAGVLSPPHSPQKCSDLGLFFIPMMRGMTAAAQGGEWQHPDVGTHLWTNHPPKSHTSLSCGILRRTQVASSSLRMESTAPQAQPEGRRGWQQKHHLLFPLPDPRNIQNLWNKGLGANHAGAGSSPRLLQSPHSECSSSPINHTCPINHTLRVNPTPAAGSCKAGGGGEEEERGKEEEERRRRGGGGHQGRSRWALAAFAHVLPKTKKHQRRVFIDSHIRAL